VKDDNGIEGNVERGYYIYIQDHHIRTPAAVPGLVVSRLLPLTGVECRASPSSS